MFLLTSNDDEALAMSPDFETLDDGFRFGGALYLGVVAEAFSVVPDAPPMPEGARSREYLYVEGAYSPNPNYVPPPEPTPEPPAPPVVPRTATPAKARLVLLAAGKLDIVEAAVAAHPDPAVRIYWEYGLEYEREHPYIVALGAALNLNLDELFLAAATV